MPELFSSSSRLALADIFDEFRADPCRLLNLSSHVIHIGTAGRQGADLIQGGILHGEVLVQIVSPTNWSIGQFVALF